MKKMAIGLLALVFGMAGAQAGYKSGSAPAKENGKLKTAPNEGSGIVDRAAWHGGVVLADGEEIALQNAGGYFLPIKLEPNSKCRIWLGGPGLISGRQVTLFTRHGGFINGKVLDSVMVGDDGRLWFDFLNGNLGSQPIHATILGVTAPIMSVMPGKAKGDDEKKGGYREIR